MQICFTYSNEMAFSQLIEFLFNRKRLLIDHPRRFLCLSFLLYISQDSSAVSFSLRLLLNTS